MSPSSLSFPFWGLSGHPPICAIHTMEMPELRQAQMGGPRKDTHEEFL
jgi:hypothetical protein